MRLVRPGKVLRFDAAHLGGRILAQTDGDAFDLVEAGILAHRPGLHAADLHAVVLRGVVRRGHLDAAAAAQMVDGEIDLRRVDHADVDGVGAGGKDAVDKGLGQRGGTGPHVPADDDHVHARVGLGQAAEIHAQELGGGVPDAPGTIFVERIGIHAADIVRLENPIEHGSLMCARGRIAGANTQFGRCARVEFAAGTLAGSGASGAGRRRRRK